MRAAWNFLSGLRLTVWLMAGIFVTLTAGGCFCLYDYAFFNGMNGAPVQDWYVTKGLARPLISWWIPLLFALFTLLGVNFVACSADRALQILKNAKKLRPLALAVQITPTVVHVLFLVVLGGHFLTFTMGRQDRVPVITGEKSSLPMGGTVEFIGVKNAYYPDTGLLAGRKSQVWVTMRLDGGKPVVLPFADFIMHNGRALHLDMDMREGRKKRIPETQPKKETCNKADNYLAKAPPGLKLQVTRDPGLALTIAGLSAIIILMSWFFVQVYARRKPAGR